ncbi:MAG TPA: ATP-binding protein [Kofleriaceae bacterium]|nr:ATP-binding protein [Kofleriaceae bacterium]
MSTSSSAPATVELDRLPVGVLLVELTGVIVAANPAASRLFGLPRDALVGRPAPALLQLDPDRWEAVREAAVQGGSSEDEVELTELQVVQLRACLAGSGVPPLLQIVAIDVTTHRARRRQRPTDDAERARGEDAASARELDSLGLVAGGIAHDFNNLLVGVLAEASAAREDRQLGEAAREALRRIEAAAGRMSQLTRQLLAYAGRGRVVTLPLDPDLLLGELREPLARIVRPPAGVEVVPGAGGVVVEADPHLLRQVVVNLVANARDASARRVQVASRILSRENAPWWQLEVSDDGAGIPPDTLARIFEPFFSTRQGRHGLGLSAVHGIVRRLGGDIEVDSQPGQGTRFRVRLPIVVGVDPRPRARAVPASPSRPLAGLHVLVADDEPSVRATVRRLLERRGATVVACADGLDAERQLAGERFDLVILDVTMPGRTGYDVLALARATQPRLPVILMSGYTARVRGEGGEEEPDAFIEKPFTAAMLDAEIDEVLRLRAAEPPP